MGSELAADLLLQWNSDHGKNYLLEAADLEWNLSQQNLVRYALTKIENTPVLLGTASAEGISLGIPARNIWLSLWGKILDEEKFVRGLLQLKSELKKKKLVIGGDEFHFVPGVPLTAAGERLRNALQAERFKGEEAADYFGDINSSPVTQYIQAAKNDFEKRALNFKEVTTAKDISEAEKFLSSEFPGRWTREFQFWSLREDTQRAFWKLLRTNENEIIGFARMCLRGRVEPLNTGWVPGALRLPLASGARRSAKDCCLGPIGVASSQRGKGTGKLLLGLVLESLRNSPVDRICIDWTNAFKYYQPLKFEVARRYWTASRLDPESN